VRASLENRFKGVGAGWADFSPGHPQPQGRFVVAEPAILGDPFTV
jgi:hypothetical protein